MNYGGSQAFTIAPNTGYHTDSVVVDGVNEGAITGRNFAGVSANHAISAYFSINVYTVTAGASAGGSISPSGAVRVYSITGGASRSRSPRTPVTHTDSVVVDGVNERGHRGPEYLQHHHEPRDQRVFFDQCLHDHRERVSGGTIAPSGSVMVNYGADQSFAITPNTGYHVDSVVVDGVNAGAITSRNFTGVSANHTIAAYFSINVYTLTAGASAGGSISPSGAVNTITGGANRSRSPRIPVIISTAWWWTG